MDTKIESLIEGSSDDNIVFRNGYAEAMGFQEQTGFPWNAGPNSEQVSDPATIFKNLRWYLISNMRQFLSEAYVEIGLVQTICKVPVDDALRGGVTITSAELDEDEIMELQADMDSTDDLGIAGLAAIWNRLFGGAAVLVLTDQDPATPLDVEAIDKDSLFQFRAVDMWELFYDKQNTEGYNPTIQEHEFEQYDYYGEKVHRSRVLILKGLTAPSFIRPRLRGWGFSVVEALVQSINAYLKNIDVTFEVIDEFKLDVFKMKNLANTLLSPGGEQAVKRRVAIANYTKNYQNALVLDSEDDFDHKQLSFAGLSDVMQGARIQVASDMRMPMIKLFGVPASGMNADDEEALEVYNSMVENEVRSKLKFTILRMIELKCQRLFGFIPDDLKIDFKPLRIMNSTDEETVKTQKFTRLLQAKAAGEITRFEFREACNKEKLLGISLDNSGDDLNPDDVEIEDVLAGADNAEEDDAENGSDTGEQGASKRDSANPKARAIPKAKKPKEPPPKEQKEKTAGNKEKANKEPKVKNALKFIQQVMRGE